MRYFILVLFSCLQLNLSAQALKIGETIPDLAFTILNEPTTTLTSDDLSGKIIILDFWATWCSPCIASMPHLDKLQNSLGDQLQVIAVSDEAPDRLKRFIQATDHQFLFAQDTGALRGLFPYGVIPHTVMINAKGVVVAITSPEHLTKAAIEKVRAGKDPMLPVKKRRKAFDPTYDYFQADTLTQYSFSLQPHNPDLPSFSKRYGQGAFKDRRLTAYNLSIDGLYRMGYQVSIRRQELEFDESLITWDVESNRYCMDVIVPVNQDPYLSVIEGLGKALPYKARVEKREKEVVVISLLAEAVNAAPGQATKNYAGRGDGFSSEGASMTQFSAYLEDFGIFGYPVVDETGISGSFKIDFSFDPEDQNTFKTAITALGLTYKKATRKIDVLVLYLEE